MEASVPAVEELKTLLINSFGPNGTSVLIQEPTGTMNITRYGYRILLSASEDNLTPIGKWIMKFVKNVHDTLGDGTKSFIIILADLLNNFNNYKTNLSRTDTILNLQKLLAVLSTKCAFSEENNDSLCNIMYCMKATSGLFYTSCPASVSSVIHDVFNKWVNLSLSCVSTQKIQKAAVSVLSCLKRNFSILCCQNYFSSRSVSDSFVSKGFLIDKLALNLSKQNSTYVKIVFFTPSKSYDNTEIEFEVKRLVSENYNEVNECYPLMLLTSAVLPELVLFLLKQKNVVVLHGISTDIIDYIYSIIYKNHVNNIVEVKCKLLGAKECTWMDLKNVYQLILSGPTDTLIHEYAYICHSALKLLLVISRGSSSLVKVGGHFEKTLHFQLLAHGDKFHWEMSNFGICSRDILLKWHHEREFLKLRTINNTIKFSNNSSNVAFEKNNYIEKSYDSSENISCKTELLNVNNVSIKHLDSKKQSNSEQSEIYPYISTPVSVSRNYSVEMSNIICALKTLDKSTLELILSSLLTVSNKIGSENVTDDIFEPVCFKVELLQQVINAFLSLLKSEIVTCK